MQVGSGLHLPHLQMRSALLAVVVSLTLNFAFVLTLGFAGVPLASILALSLGSLYYGWMLTGALKDRFFPFLGEVFLRPFLAAALPAVLLLWLNSHWIVPRLLEAGRVRAIFYVGVLFSLYLCVYAVLLFLSGHVKPEDLEFFKTLIPRRESQAEAWRDYAPREP
jgi:peptidoglycan biosynthesis protein MviN/MurJ (putative lipid II flippase)